MIKKKLLHEIRDNAIVGLCAALLFSLAYILGILGSLEDRLYDFFLRFRANRHRIENIAFLDVDDHAIFYNGVFPWPRSVPAEGLLRLKEYEPLAVIFDIEYIDRGPQGVDSVYLNQGLKNDFNRSFSEISSATQEVLSALRSGRIGRSDIGDYTGSLINIIDREHKNLYTRAQSVARDNDLYLAQSFALNKNSWATLNLRENPLDGEQAERRPVAQELFSYPLKASIGANRGAGFVDVLPPLPMFAKAVKGAGFTNVEIDNDGIRRRVYLTQNINDHWYLQLAFAPLIDYFGKPEIELTKNKLTIKQAQFSGNEKKDIVIPLDSRGRMMLDWPIEDFEHSYSHVSFADFSLLDEIEAELEYYTRALGSADLMTFVQFDPSISRVPGILAGLEENFDNARMAKIYALEKNDEDSFNGYTGYRRAVFTMLRELVSLNVDEKVKELAARLGLEHPESAEFLEDEADYIAQLINAIKVDFDRRNELNESNDKMLRNKFVILGRTDTGTTDYGANPFHGKYINVGTHAVVLDTILSESFIILLNYWWRVVFMILFVPLFFIASARFSNVLRAVLGFTVTLIIFAGSAFLFRFTGIFWGPLGTVFAMIGAVITREIISHAGSEKEKQFIRTAFSTYVSHDVVKEIISDPSRLQLGGTNRHMTAIFTDVQGFSTISEQLDPEELVSLLNSYLSAMSDIVLEEKGTIDKYEGDAIIAFFGAPLNLADHALRACVSAINMKKAEKELNKIVIEQKLSPAPLFTRIGINTGNMVAGNMGTENKMNYTIMGNAVNLAARLEGVNKQYGTWILASEDTIRETGHQLLSRKLDLVRVVGINEPVRLYELLELSELADSGEKKLVQIFHSALDLFEKRNWKSAADGFKEALSIKNEDYPSQMYLTRCEQFILNPPDDKWDGVYNLTSK
ncbi:MAG: adenylate/guanylate cyclase domain-containing protein [Treponema sp.]|jgi:adenylate cyclase|nr:adenylate/guanylate cyclase domain-containing protein [Treponema sp.]